MHSALEDFWGISEDKLIQRNFEALSKQMNEEILRKKNCYLQIDSLFYGLYIHSVLYCKNILLHASYIQYF